MTEYRTESLPALTLLQFTDRIPENGEVGPAVGALFGRLLPALPILGLGPDHPTVAWYGGVGPDTEIGVGVETTAAPVSGLAVGTLAPVERAVVARHRGTLDGIGAAWAALHGHLASEGLTPTGPCREIYLAGSVDGSDPWVVELQQPVG